jgi:hypothetical protein
MMICIQVLLSNLTCAATPWKPPRSLRGERDGARGRGGQGAHGRRRRNVHLRPGVLRAARRRGHPRRVVAGHRRESERDADGVHGARCADPGRAVQVDPIKPTLKAPGTKRLKLKCDDLLLNFGFKFKLRRYTLATTYGAAAQRPSNLAGGPDARLPHRDPTQLRFDAPVEAVNAVGRCRLTPSNPR